MYRGGGEHCWWVALNFVTGSHYQHSEIKINWLSGLPYITLYMLPWVWFPSYRNSMEADRNSPTTSCSFGISSSYSILAGKLVVQSQTKEWWKVINIASVFNHTVSCLSNVLKCTVINLWILYNLADFLTIWAAVCFSRSTLISWVFISQLWLAGLWYFHVLCVWPSWLLPT